MRSPVWSLSERREARDSAEKGEKDAWFFSFIIIYAVGARRIIDGDLSWIARQDRHWHRQTSDFKSSSSPDSQITFIQITGGITDRVRVLHAVTNYKGHVIRDTFLRLVKFLKKIRDRLLHGNEFKAIHDTLTLK